jgi:hypothetical protein
MRDFCRGNLPDPVEEWKTCGKNEDMDGSEDAQHRDDISFVQFPKWRDRRLERRVGHFVSGPF